MQLKNLFAGVVVAATTLAFAGVANAQTTYDWVGGTSSFENDWNVAGNWNPVSGGGTTYPQSGDTAIIPDGISVSNAPILNVTVTIAELQVQEDAFLRLNSSNKLTVTGNVLVEAADDATSEQWGIHLLHDSAELEIGGKLTVEFDASKAGLVKIGDGSNGGQLRLTSGANAHEIGGQIRLANADSKVFVDANMTFGPGDPGGTPRYGFVDGLANAALIKIADGVTLTNQIRMLGAMVIDGVSGGGTETLHVDGSANGGIVRADRANLTLALGANLDLTDDADALWEASGQNNAVLQFDKDTTSPALAGDFLLDDSAILRFNENVLTSGGFTNNDGDVEVAAAKCFCWNNGSNCHCGF